MSLDYLNVQHYDMCTLLRLNISVDQGCAQLHMFIHILTHIKAI